MRWIQLFKKYITSINLSKKETAFVWNQIKTILNEPLSWQEKFKKINLYLNENTSKITCLPLQNLGTSGNEYCRNLIGQEVSLNPFAHEAFLMSWSKENSTPVHGHPPVVFYKVLSGKFLMRFYDYNNKRIKEKNYRLLEAGSTVFQVNKEKHYEHFIHKVECLEDGITFNFYNGSARKGITF